MIAQTDTKGIASREVSIDLNKYTRALSSAPKQQTSKSLRIPLKFEIPMPYGTTESFDVVESSIMDDDFAAAYPTFKTYAVQGANRRELTGRISITPYGFNAVILAPEGFIHIHPLDMHNPILHKVALVNLSEDIIECHTIEAVEKSMGKGASNTTKANNGVTKRTYTLAIVGTGEFHDANGGSVAAASAVALNSVNGIQAIFERELSVAFNLLTPFIYQNAGTDPFNQGLNRTLEAAQAVEANFSGQGYDLGHVFHDSNQGSGILNSGGIAGLGVVCNNFTAGTGFQKAAGWSSSFDNVSPGWIKLAAHEFGHMFNMTHTFNGDGFNCTTGNHPLNTAYEIGSGTSIMSYQGICDDQYNIPSSGLADHYFHVNSLDRAVTYINNETCHAGTPTGNNPPVANVDPCNSGPYSIPLRTPFRLTGSGTDANGDQIYYSWEQYDEDGAGVEPTHGFIGAQAAASATAPLFRSYPPTTSPSRTFPNMDLVRTNQYTSSFEPLPSVPRTLNFRLTARDWKVDGGGIDYNDLAVTVSNSAALTVSAPSGGENLTAGNTTTVTWSNTTSALSATVNILLSIDGGSTFPYTLASGVPNDGSQIITIPAGVANTTSARMMVESASNTCVVFFDISDANFTIASNCQAATSNICPTTPINLAAGNAGLNLNMNQYFGGEVSQVNYNLNGNSPITPIANLTVAGGDVCQNPGTGRTNTFDFTVSTTATYSFNADPKDNDFIIFSIFSADNFNPNSPCSSFLGSNSNGAYGIGGGATNVKLTACTSYKLVMWSLNATMDGFISISGSGSVLSSLAGPGADYSYTFAAVNSTTNQIAAVSNSANFMSLTGGSYQIYGASYFSGTGTTPAPVNPANWVGQTRTQILSGGSCVLFSTNSRPVTIVGAPCTNPPTVNAPTITQPTCAVPTGILIVNSTGAGALQYSTNNGATFQTSNTFSNLAPGNYNIITRLQADPTCTTVYAQNPVVLNTPNGCNGNCNEFIAGNLPITIPTTVGTVNSTITVTTGGTITDVNIKNLNVTHSYVGDLTFTLMSPQGTSVILIQNQCNNDNTGFNIKLDDAAVADLSCPLSAGNTQKPANLLAAFNGQNPIGTWTLIVNDNANEDGGALTGWTLEICSTGASQMGFTCATATEITGPGTFNAPGPSQGNGAIAGSGFTHANWYRFIPPTSGMIRIFTCGLTGAGNQHNHVYHVNTTSCNTLKLDDVVYTEDRGCTNDPAQGVKLENVPVTAGVPIYIEWDNALSSTPFTWTLEYQTAGSTCTDYMAADTPVTIPTAVETITSTVAVATGGIITDVNIKNLNGTHTWNSDLTFTLRCPSGISVVLFANQCGDEENFNINLDDDAANALSCPISAGNTQKPTNALSAFNGQNPMGNWVLTIADSEDQDGGSLNGWTLEICATGGDVNCPPNIAKNELPIASGTYQASSQLTSMGRIDGGSNVIFRSGNNVELRSNFQIAPTANLEINIGGCQ